MERSNLVRAIPLDFVRRFSDSELLGKMKITAKWGATWEVEICKNPGFFYMEKAGWNRFLRDNSLGDGDLLTFTHKGAMCFTVKIFKEILQPPQPTALFASFTKSRNRTEEQREGVSKDVNKEAEEERTRGSSRMLWSVSREILESPLRLLAIKKAFAKDHMPATNATFTIHHPDEKKSWSVGYLPRIDPNGRIAVRFPTEENHPMLRSRRSRSRHGAQACAVMSAVLLLASVSLLYTRLSLFSSHSPNHLRSGPGEDAVLFPDSLLVSDSDVVETGGGRGSSTSSEDRIDEHDDAIEDDRNDGVSNEEDENQDAEQEVDLNRNKASCTGFYFDHVTGVIRRAFNKRSIDEWDYDYAGFSIGSGAASDDSSSVEKSRAAFGSDDVPLDESIRRKIVEVSSVEDALLLKSSKRVSPLREGWGDWFDKKGDFLRRDRMFKSNIETLNPLNNPMLQDPDGVGITTLTRGDKVVLNWRLSEIKRNPFMAKKPLSVAEKKETNELRESRKGIRLQNSVDDRKSEIKSGERKTLDDDKKIETKEVENVVHDDEFRDHMYADGTRWGYYPGVEPSLSFSDFMDSFFRNEKCSVRVFMVWNSPGWMFSVRHQRGLESLLSQHRDACVVVFSETVELDFFRNSFVKDGYKVAVAMPNLDELLRDTPTHVFASVWFDWRKTKFYPTHYSELVRLAALYKYGGIYLDSDVIVLGPLSSLKNTLGVEDQAAGESLNGAVMSFEKKSSFLLECLNEYYLTYDDKCVRCNGADLLTRVAKRFLNGKNRRMTQQELNIRPFSVFFPISSQQITSYFAYPATEDEKSQQEGLFKKIINESLTFHFWNSVTSSLIPEPESLVARVLDHSCIRCSDVL
ncbi:unnamed protein product [Thlaspi arvense]|uniref:TF-B3 domain-containing protein n=1 Tax=Thlaspi arvense TaxID=13288 RepID=A0AAU9T2C5_THLAR|nr:unnamed protein product [Thlaspi arvense]